MIRDSRDDGDIVTIGNPLAAMLVRPARGRVDFGREVMANEENSHGGGSVRLSID